MKRNSIMSAILLIACVLFIGPCILASVDLQPKTANGLPLCSQ